MLVFLFPRTTYMQCMVSMSTWIPTLLCKLSTAQGVYGWRLQPEVKVYSSYEAGDPPPEPEDVETDVVDHSAARTELVQLGIMQET